MAFKEARVPEGWKLAKVRLNDSAPRWSVKYTKSKEKDGADPRVAEPTDLATSIHGLICTWDASAVIAHDRTASRRGQQRQHRLGPLGRHCLSAQEERGLPPHGRVHQPH